MANWDVINVISYTCASPALINLNVWSVKKKKERDFHTICFLAQKASCSWVHKQDFFSFFPYSFFKFFFGLQPITYYNDQVILSVPWVIDASGQKRSRPTYTLLDTFKKHTARKKKLVITGRRERAHPSPFHSALARFLPPSLSSQSGTSST